VQTGFPRCNLAILPKALALEPVERMPKDGAGGVGASAKCNVDLLTTVMNRTFGKTGQRM
jgi:hypothetical protein